MMSLEQKKAYLETIRKRYKKATKKQKAIILNRKRKGVEKGSGVLYDL